jgi:PAS domain S-box-containing protein
VSGIGIFDHDLVADTIYGSPELLVLYGWRDSATITIQTFLEHTHPEDRELVGSAIRQAHDPSGNGRFELEYRIVRTDGAVRRISARAETHFDGDGSAKRPVRVIGSIMDVTDARAAADLLREREASLQRSERLARIGYFAVDASGETMTSSEGNNRIWGFPAGALPSNAELRSRVSPEDLAKFRAAWSDLLTRDQGHVEFEFTVRQPDGTNVVVRSLMELSRNPLTNSVKIFGTNIDVTAQKRAEAALAASEERLLQAIRLGRLGIFDHDHRTGNIYWSPEQRAIWGIGPDEEPAAPAACLVAPDDRATLASAVAASHDVDGDGTFNIEHRIVTKAGDTRWIHTRAQTSFEGEGSNRRSIRTVGATADITERKLVERDLVIKQDAIASAATGILICGLDTRIAYVNDAWLRIYGYESASEVLGTTPLDHNADRAQHEAVRRALAETGNWVGPITGRRRDGSIFEGELVVSKVTDATGAPVAFLGSILDATERHTAQAALRRSEAVLRSVFDASLDAIFVSRHQRLVFGNPATAAMFGYDSIEQMEGINMGELVALSERDRVGRFYDARQAGEAAPSRYETRMCRRDGTEFDVEVSASSYTVDGAVYPVVVLRDITARKAAERALRASAERLYAVFNSTSDGQLLLRVDHDGRLFIVSANRAYHEIRQTFFPNAPSQVEGIYRDEMLAAQGLSAELIELEAPAHRQVIQSRRPLSHEFEILLPNGEVAAIESRIEPVLDEEGRCTHLLWSGRDIRERRRAQEAVRQLNAMLEQRVAERTEQLEAANRELEAFAYSVSHDLRAPARAVDGFAGILVEDYGPRLDAEGLRLCGVVRGEAQRMGRLIDDLLMLSRLGRTAMQSAPVDMATLAREVFDDLTKDADRLRVMFRLDELPSAIGDRSLLRQVWVNLLGNALKFSARLPCAIIQVHGRREGHDVVYTVRDNGAGFDMAYQQKLFGVFQRLHSDHEFEGTGVGLAIVQRVVRRHGGRVWAEGTVGRGASFTFALPVEDREA